MTLQPLRWRNVSKTSKTGIVFPQYRLSLGPAELVLTADPTPESKPLGGWHIRCFAVSLPETRLYISVNEPEKAQDAALRALLKHINDQRATGEVIADILTSHGVSLTAKTKAKAVVEDVPEPDAPDMDAPFPVEPPAEPVDEPVDQPGTETPAKKKPARKAPKAPDEPVPAAAPVDGPAPASEPEPIPAPKQPKQNDRPSAINNAVMNIDTGDVYPSAREAAAVYGGQPQTVRQCCNGRRPTAYGFHWKYIEAPAQKAEAMPE